MQQLSKRQRVILEYIHAHPQTSNREIVQHLQEVFDVVSRVTIVRDIQHLLQEGVIQKQGEGRSVTYQAAENSPLMRYIDVADYFSQEADERTNISERFDMQVMQGLHDVFTPQELKELETLNTIYLQQKKTLPTRVIQKEFERLTIELSWKSSQIEGNTYSLIDTELLITEHKEAEGHSKQEAIMILNHKRALDYILQHYTQFQKLTLAHVQDIHRLLVEGLDVQFGFRTHPVGIVGTRYRPLDNQHQIREAMEKAIEAINHATDPFTKAFIALLMLAYIQPFEDGNKRTSRLIANALLLAYEVCPLSFRSIQESDYKKAVIVFYEQHSARYLKQLFIEQFRFAVRHYFFA